MRGKLSLTAVIFITLMPLASSTSAASSEMNSPYHSKVSVVLDSSSGLNYNRDGMPLVTTINQEEFGEIREWVISTYPEYYSFSVSTGFNRIWVLKTTPSKVIEEIDTKLSKVNGKVIASSDYTDNEWQKIRDNAEAYLSLEYPGIYFELSRGFNPNTQKEPKPNQLEVKISQELDVRKFQKAVSLRENIPIEVNVIRTSEKIHRQSDNQYNSAQMDGGRPLFTSAGELACTSAFSAETNYNGNTYEGVVTARHCLNQLYHWYDGRNILLENPSTANL